MAIPDPVEPMQPDAPTLARLKATLDGRIPAFSAYTHAEDWVEVVMNEAFAAMSTGGKGGV